VQLNMWNKAVVSRKNQLGLLSLNDELSVKGRSLGHLRQLNLPQRLYLGGLPPHSTLTAAGLIGAIQRVHIIHTQFNRVCKWCRHKASL